MLIGWCPGGHCWTSVMFFCTHQSLFWLKNLELTWAQVEDMVENVDRVSAGSSAPPLQTLTNFPTFLPPSTLPHTIQWSREKNRGAQPSPPGQYHTHTPAASPCHGLFSHALSTLLQGPLLTNQTLERRFYFGQFGLPHSEKQTIFHFKKILFSNTIF